MRTRRRAFGPFGPVYFYPEGEGAAGDPPAGDPPAGSGGGAPPASNGGTPPAPPAGTGEPTIPKSRFDEINTEYQRLKKAEEERQAEEAKRKGEYEKLAADEKVKRESAEAGKLAAERKLAFVTASAGKVADVAAAHKLAAADGLLDQIEIENGDAKDPAAVGKLIDELVKTYAFLKPGAPTTGRGFGGGDHGANGVPEGVDPSKLSAQELMRIGVSQGGKQGRS